MLKRKVILVKPEERVSELFRPSIIIRELIRAKDFINARSVSKALLPVTRGRGICFYIWEIDHIFVMNADKDF